MTITTDLSFPLQENTKQYIQNLLKRVKSIKFTDKLYCEDDEITGHSAYNNINWDTPILKILKFILKQREKGATQIEISRHFAIDPKSTFHFIKILSTTDLIQKISVLASGNRTNLFIHKRYSTSDIEHKKAITKENISDMLRILNESTNKTLKCQDLMVLVGIDIKEKIMRKSFYRVLHKLQREKYLEFISVPNKTTYDKCVRLLDYPYLEKKNKPTVASSTKIGLKHFLSFDVQLYLLIKKNNNQGMTIKDICNSFPTIPKKKLLREVQRMEGKFKGPKIIKSVQENIGKLSRYVYFCVEDYPWAKDYVETQIAETPRKISKIAMIKEYVLYILEKEKVHEGQASITTKVNELAKEWDKLDHMIDRKTVQKAINLLELDNEVKTHQVAVQIPNGNIVQKTILSQPNIQLADPEVKHLIELFKQNYFKTTVTKPRIVQDLEIDRLQVPKYVEIDDSPNWKEFAKKFGFVTPKMKRARLLHRWLFALNEETIETSWIFNKMHLGLALEIIGQTQQSDELEQYLLQDGARDTQLQDLPEEIKKLKFNKSRFRTVLLELLNILSLLDLVSPLNYDHYSEEYSTVNDQSNIHLYYKIHYTANLLDYTGSVPTIQQTIHLDLQSIDTFWKTLEYNCLSCTKAEEGQYAVLFQKKNWKEIFTLDQEQKKILESYIDYKTKSTPMQNELLCQSLAKRIGFSITMIKYFYSKVEKRFAKTIGDRSRIKKKVPEPVEEEEDTEEKSKTRRLRVDWTLEDDENILLSFVILSQYSLVGKFPLAYLPQLFPDNNDITKDRIRRRIIILKRKYSNTQKIAFYRSQWPKFQQEYQHTNPIDLVCLATNLAAAVSDFKTFLAQIERPAEQDLNLPHDLETFEQNYQINEARNNYLAIENGDPIQVQLETKRTLTSKLQFLYSVSFSFEKSTISDYTEYQLTQTDLKMFLLTCIIKMITITPNNLYRPEIAWLTLKKYDEDDIKTVTNQLIDKSVLIRKTYGKGKQFYPSDKFVELLSGSLPSKMFNQSASYLKSLENVLRDNGKTTLPVRKEPGIMAVLLELVTDANLVFVCKIPPVSIDDPNLVSNVKIQIVEKSGGNKRKAAEDSDGEDEQLERAKSASRAISQKRPQPEIESVLRALDDAGLLGMSYTELTHKTKIPNLQNTLILLENDKIYKVGFDFPIYIHAKYKSSWLIEVAKPIEVTDLDSEPTKTYSTPKLWYTLTGDLVPNVYKACCELVLGVLVETPGIFLTDLQKRVETVLTKVELEQILLDLEKRVAIRHVKVQVEKECENILCALFNDPEHEIATAYFPLDKWYTKSGN
ncbi:hypothetical protein HDV01_001195 [Terramyces sp. JEL0728]|nr:hypothetical protein HDV01_001195 [Terramyces sp. JEL0728]